jgi:predicted O-linked N-acetylglucosamine transferase (SPINDLY family)
MSRRAATAGADAGALLTQAVQLHQSGELKTARRLYEDVLIRVPEQPDALHLLGVLALQSGRPADAVMRIRRAVARRPDSAVYHGNLGVALQATGQVHEARASLERAVALDARNVDALFNLGVTLQALDLPEEAVGWYQRVLALAPAHTGAYRNLGNALHALGRSAEAVEAYGALLALTPPDAAMLGSLGTALTTLERHDEAMSAFEAAVKLAPADADAWMNLGVARHRAKRYPEAIEAYQQALTIRPEHAEGWLSLGRAVNSDEGRFHDAIEPLKRAVALLNGSDDRPPASIELRLSALRDLVSALALDNRWIEVIEFQRMVVELDPEYADAWRHLGLAQSMSGMMEEGVKTLAHAIDLNPTNANYLEKLIFSLDMIPSTTLEHAYRVRRQFNERHALPLTVQSRPHTNVPDPTRRLRVGYVSADFRQHSATTTFVAILEHHDPALVEVACYSNSRVNDPMTERIKAAASLWRQVDKLSDEELAEQIRADEIDVLVDLSGYSGGNRILTIARKPAPVQVTAWGYATSTGLDAVDAFFADPVVVPPEAEPLYAEKIVHLPNVVCYTQPPVHPPIPPLPALSQGFITFGSYNRSSKITPAVLETWARVLHAVPGSRLLLKPSMEDTPTTRARLLDPLAYHGIDLSRVDILGMHPLLEHIAAFGRTDLQLDPFPHTGGVTTLDGLLMGVPVVTLVGERVPERLSASFLTALGLEDLIAHSIDEYVEIAVRLANDLDRLVYERATLRERLLTSPIGDAVRYTQAVEAAYRDLWTRWCDGQATSGAPLGATRTP